MIVGDWKHGSSYDVRRSPAQICCAPVCQPARRLPGSAAGCRPSLQADLRPFRGKWLHFKSPLTFFPNSSNCIAHDVRPIGSQGREVLMQVLMDNSSPMQKRIAAYLVLMKDPKPTELAQLAAFLPREENQQVKSFVESHIANILSSKMPETEEYVGSTQSCNVYLETSRLHSSAASPFFSIFLPRLRQMIRNVMQDNEIGPVMDATKFSRNYQMGSLEGNVIFEGNSYLPKEAMLEMTLRAFGYDIDMMEVKALSLHALESLQAVTLGEKNQIIK